MELVQQVEQAVKRDGEISMLMTVTGKISVAEDKDMSGHGLGQSDSASVLHWLGEVVDLKAGRSLFKHLTFCDCRIDFLGRLQFLFEEKKIWNLYTPQTSR